MRPRLRCSLFITTTVVALGPAISSASAAAEPTSRAPADGNWLYVQTAKQATLRPVKGTGAFRLTLIEPAERVRALFGSAGRQVDFESTTGFVRSWAEAGFARTAPNAAIVANQGDPEEDTLLVKLSQPLIGFGGRISYIARPLRAFTPGDLSYFGRRADPRLPTRLGATSVFLDSAAPVDQLPFYVGWGTPVQGSITVSGVLKPGAVSSNGPFDAIFGGFSYEDGKMSFSSRAYAGSSAGTISARADVVGYCLSLYLALDSGGPVWAYVPAGPKVPLKPGMNQLSFRAGMECGQ